MTLVLHIHMFQLENPSQEISPYAAAGIAKMTKELRSPTFKK